MNYPSTWESVTIGESLDLINGRAFKPNEWSTAGRPIIRIQNLNNPKAAFNYYAGDLPEKFSVATGDLLFAWSGTPGTSFGAHIWKGPDAWLNQHIFKVVFPSNVFDKTFLQFAINQNLAQYIGVAHGGAGLAHITKGKFEASDILLPPLAEQKRIVAKIEELFSELDAGEESLRVARRQLGVYRQSLLKQAFEGKLTAQWRTQNPAKPESWVSTTVGKVGRIETGTTPPTDDQSNYGGDLPFFKPTDLEQGRYVKTARSHLSAAGQRSARVLPLGSVLVTCIGATIGKTGLAQLACATNQQINSISPTEDVAPEFAYFQVISPQFQEQIKTNASSTTLPILNKSKFSALSFVRCSLPEQQEIVRLLDAQFEVIERNERELDAALKRSEALRQAILKKAFTGRLVSQDPTDEPASELLARLRADRPGPKR